MANFDVPGNITDSRLVGDVMYLVTQQWLGCWRCSEVPASVVTSFDVSDPSDITEVDHSVRTEADFFCRPSLTRSQVPG